MIPRFKKFIKAKKQVVQEVVARPAESVQANAPITNETIAARREEVLGSARKYIYPLQASKRRIVKLSIGLVVAAVVAFFAFCSLELYKFQATSAFIYGVTQVVPFPVAIIDKHFVSYNDYLFQLRHYIHYYQTQQSVDFNDKSGKQQLAVFKQSSLDQAVQQAYVEQLADKNHLSVSDKDVDAAVALVRSQNRLGASDQVFQNVLSEFWGWSVADFRRELRSELLAQKVVDRLDTGTHARADQALAQLKQGADFSELAKHVSDDSTVNSNGGDYGVLIGKSNNDIAPQVLDQLFRLRTGEYSGVINTGYSLEIVKVLEVQGNQVRAAHISLNFKPINTYTAPLKAANKPHVLIHV